MDNIDLSEEQWVNLLHNFCDAIDPRLPAEQNVSAALAAAEISSTVSWMVASGFVRQVITDLAIVVTPGDPSETLDMLMNKVRNNFSSARQDDEDIA